MNALPREDGYFGIRSHDGLGYETGSVSSTIDKLHDTMVNCSINDADTWSLIRMMAWDLPLGQMWRDGWWCCSMKKSKRRNIRQKGEGYV